MRKIILLAITMLTFMNCKKEESLPSENATVATVEKKESKTVIHVQKVDLKIEGMTCAIGCAKTIEGKLKALEGVQNATVNFDTKTATIEFDGAVQSVVSLTKMIEGVADGKTYKVIK